MTDISVLVNTYDRYFRPWQRLQLIFASLATPIADISVLGNTYITDTSVSGNTSITDYDSFAELADKVLDVVGQAGLCFCLIQVFCESCHTRTVDFCVWYAFVICITDLP